MSFSILIVVLLAGLLHVSWNFQVKRTKDKYLSMTSVVLGSIPFTASAILFSPALRPGTFVFVIAGAILHTGYQLFLLNSYKIGDLSQVYPLARGVSPLIVAGVSVAFLEVDLSGFELIAIVMIGTGIMSLTLVRRSDGQRNGRAALFAVLTGGFIAAYSLVDGSGAKQAGTALGFYGYLSITNSFMFGTIMRFMRPGLVKKALFQDWKMALSGGGQSFVAYALVMWAFTQAPIALVTAVRETSIVFALLLGVFFLKERLDLMKVFATLLTILGVVVMRFVK